MYIIKTEPYENGGRPPIQTWNSANIPDGYSLIGEDNDVSVFYEYKGFVLLTFDDDNKTVVGMMGNQEALEEYNNEHPDKPVDPEPTTQDVLDALLGG